MYKIYYTIILLCILFIIGVAFTVVKTQQDTLHSVNKLEQRMLINDEYLQNGINNLTDEINK